MILRLKPFYSFRNQRWRWILLIVFLPLNSFSQTLTGISGLLNVPSAIMNADGTFIAGGNYLPKINQPVFGYNTGNYYFNLTFLPFLEVSYKLTLLQTSENINQDRSASFKLQVVKERPYFPAVAIGVHDVHTTSIGNGNQFFEANYFVLSKGLALGKGSMGLTVGYGTDLIMKKSQFVGLFGGCSFSPAYLNQLKLIGEYDCHGINLGGSILILKHLNLLLFAQHMSYLAGGLSYRVYLK